MIATAAMMAKVNPSAIRAVGRFSGQYLSIDIRQFCCNAGNSS